MNEHLELMWDQYRGRLLAFIRSQVANAADAEDILQEVFIRIHRHLCCQPEPEWNKPESWIYQIARHLIIDYYRRQHRFMEIPESLPAEYVIPEDDPEAILALSLRELIDELPELYRQALILTEYQGLTQKQLAERMGISLSGAKSRVQRARDKLREMLLRCCHFEFDRRGHIVDYYRGAGVVVATAAAVATPFCSCGTTAVLLGMMASRMPWAPIVAFMVASPLTSPQGLVYSAGLFGWPFALAFYLASIVLGLVGGWAAAVIERCGWLANQARFREPVSAPCACPATSRTATAPNRGLSRAVPAFQLSPFARVEATGTALAASCGCGQAALTDDGAARRAAWIVDRSRTADTDTYTAARGPNVSLTTFLGELSHSGTRLLAMFVGFAFIGYVLNGLIPAPWVAAAFGPDKIYNVPLAATLGLPLYVNAEASLPLVRALLDNGMSQGAALAFLISGAGTSIGAIAGALTIARWRVVALVVAVLWVGAILSGLAFNLALLLQLF